MAPCSGISRGGVGRIRRRCKDPPYLSRQSSGRSTTNWTWSRHLCIAAAGLSVEIVQLLGQAVHNIGTASKEAADRRLRVKEIALEKQRLDLEVARLAQQDKHLERILPAGPVSASAQAQMAPTPLVHGDSPAGGNVVVINQPPARLWSPGRSHSQS